MSCRTTDLLLKPLITHVSFSARPQVIYALNTKNDEHEEEIESLKEAHEDEVRSPQRDTHRSKQDSRD